MYGLTRDPIADTGVLEGSLFSEFVTVGDAGCVALKTTAGQFISQVPNACGRFELRDTPGPYETFGGGPGIGIKTTWTRPTEDPPDKVFSYFCVQLPNV